jgi:hypothetical protein
LIDYENFGLGRPDESAQAFERVLKIEPQDKLARQFLNKIHKLLNKSNF